MARMRQQDTNINHYSLQFFPSVAHINVICVGATQCADLSEDCMQVSLSISSGFAIVSGVGATQGAEFS